MGDRVALLQQAVAYCDAGRHEEGEAVSRALIALDPGRQEGYLLRATILQDLGRVEEADAAAREAVERAPGDLTALILASNLALLTGSAEQARRLAEHCLALKPEDQRAQATLTLALIHLGADEEVARRLDFPRRIRVFPAAAGRDFNRAVAAAVAARPDLDREHQGKTLVSGARLHDTFVIGPPLADALRRMFADAVRAYDGGAADGLRLMSWANVMEGAAFEHPHIHEGSRISGVYYPEMPEPAPSTDLPDAGAIEFGGHEFGTQLPRTGPTWRLQPEPGMLVLFPSCFYHRTIPFTGKGRRISIAFDVKL